jgi:hypothetical protein
MKLRRLFLISTGALIAVACTSELVSDSTFDAWCGDRLCSWKVDAGSVAHAKTWHSGDDGIELVGSPSAISQIIRPQTQHLELQIVADFEPNADVAIELDIGDDGTLDYSNVIPAGPPWSLQSMVIDLPGPADPTRLRIHKRGSGRARIGRLSLQEDSISFDLTTSVGEQCSGDSDLFCETSFCKKAANASEGICTRCTSDADCGDNRFCDLSPCAVVPGACYPIPFVVMCTDDAQCSSGDICGALLGHLSSAGQKPYKQCKAPGSVPLGDACLADRECASGVCCANENRTASVCANDRSRCTL